MVKKNFLEGMLVIMLVFGMMVFGCSSDPDDDFGDITITVTGLDPSAYPTANNFWVEFVGYQGIIDNPGWPPSGTSQVFSGTDRKKGEYRIRLVISENTGSPPVSTILFEGMTTSTYSVPGNHSIPFTAFN
jgi:hypothetical protein